MAARLSPSPPRQYKADRDLAKMGDDFIFFAGLIGVESWTVLTPALFHSERRLRFFPFIPDMFKKKELPSFNLRLHHV